LRKLIVSLVVVMAICVVPVSAEEVERSQEAYLEAKAEIASATDTGRDLVDLYLKAAALTPNGWVRAWQLNNAAHVLIQMADEKKGKNGLADGKLIREALVLLGKAKPLSEAGMPLTEEGKAKWNSAAKTIEKNILYCERSLGLKAWD